jgi:hypothetical protein
VAVVVRVENLAALVGLAVREVVVQVQPPLVALVLLEHLELLTLAVVVVAVHLLAARLTVATVAPVLLLSNTQTAIH